ncbi:hypothetical protein [uncultured Clostridium sp.]|uniref:hypothetical protein n=1 Tax=uncultured Clostridium sp. TaxID=59620 RepID=UPI0028E285A9|nr:hypothetical protein [uncultured Clostridium sp.]
MCLVDCNKCQYLKENNPTEEEVLIKGAKYYECTENSESFKDDNTVLDIALGYKKGINCLRYKFKIKLILNSNI